MFVEQEMELIEGRPAHQPMMLLVERVENLGVGQNLVQALAGIRPRIMRQPERKQPDRPELLNFPAMHVQMRLAAESRGLPKRLRGLDLPSLSCGGQCPAGQAAMIS